MLGGWLQAQDSLGTQEHPYARAVHSHLPERVHFMYKSNSSSIIWWLGGWGGGEGGVIKQETVQTLGAQVGSCSRLDANKRTCIHAHTLLATPLLATSLIHSQLSPWREKGFWAEGACSHPPTQQCCLFWHRSQSLGFPFFSDSIF